MSRAIENRPDDNPIESQRALSPESFAGLTISRYEIHLRAAQEAFIPTFPGSTLRGTFGHALKHAVCVMSHRDCERCLVANKCIYPYIFETPVPPDIPILRNQRDAPHPFVLDPPVYQCRQHGQHGPKESEDRNGPQWEKHHVLAIGDEIVFNLTLMGRAIEYLPYVVYAIHEMAQRGMGKGRAEFSLSEVSSIGAAGVRSVIYSEASQRLDVPEGDVVDLNRWITARLAQLGEAIGRDRTDSQSVDRFDSLRMRFITPTRIKTHNNLHPQVDFALLIRNVMRRLSMLMAVHGERQLELDFRALLERAATVGTGRSSMRWWDWARYSGKQQTQMKLGGFVGEIVYEGGAIPEFMPLLAAGEILRVGNGTGFGLGRYELLDSL